MKFIINKLREDKGVYTDTFIPSIAILITIILSVIFHVYPPFRNCMIKIFSFFGIGIY